MTFFGIFLKKLFPLNVSFGLESDYLTSVKELDLSNGLTQVFVINVCPRVKNTSLHEFGTAQSIKHTSYFCQSFLSIAVVTLFTIAGRKQFLGHSGWP